MRMLLFSLSACVLIFCLNAPIIIAIPIAIHQLIVVNISSSSIIRFKGFDSANPKLVYKIQTVPDSGKVYQLSQVFSDYGYLPIQGETLTGKATVTGSQNRIYYMRPSPDKEVNNEWDTFFFTALDGPNESSMGIVKFVPPSGTIRGSDFFIDNEGWQIVGNKNQISPANYERFTRGGEFSNYIFGSDDTINKNLSGGDDSLWYFVAPNKFHGNFGLAYLGFLSFSLTAFAGDITTNNGGQVPVVILECSECMGPIRVGQRLIMPLSALDSKYIKDKSSPIKSFTFMLSETSGWLKDSQNSLHPWAPVTKCDMIQVLSRLSGIRILGDWTPWYETIALDNIRIHNTKGQLPMCSMVKTDASICSC